EVVDDDRVVEAAAEREVALAQELDVAHEAERARAADFLHERRAREVDLRDLAMALENRVVEVDLEADLEALVRREARPFAGVAHFDLLLDADEALRRVLLRDARALQQEH